jgi:hypothetical protein
LTKLLTATAMLAALTVPAVAYDASSSSLANSLKMTIYYRNVCPYGRLKVPHQLHSENEERWAYLPDETKRKANKDVYQAIDDMGVEKFCKWNDDWFDKNWGKPDELEVEREKELPELYVNVTGASRLTDAKYQFYLTAVNNSDTNINTEWTCQFSNKAKTVIKEWKVTINNVAARSRIITKQEVVFYANVDTVFCK